MDDIELYYEILDTFNSIELRNEITKYRSDQLCYMAPNLVLIYKYQ